MGGNWSNRYSFEAVAPAFEILAKMSDSAHTPTPEGLLMELVRCGGAERGFLVWEDRIWAVDVDGFSLGHGRDRLQRDWLPAAGRVSKREEPSAVLATTLQTGVGIVSVLLEHRFSTCAFVDLDDEEFRRCVLVAAVGLRWATDSVARGAGLPRSTPLAAAASAPLVSEPSGSEAEVESRSALEEHDWNISRAARSLGMTRHGLKKRMSRLGIQRPTRNSSEA